MCIEYNRCYVAGQVEAADSDHQEVAVARFEGAAEALILISVPLAEDLTPISLHSVETHIEDPVFAIEMIITSLGTVEVNTVVS